MNMNRTCSSLCIVALLLALAPAVAPAASDVTIDTGKLRLTFRADGSGFLDEIAYTGRVVASYRTDPPADVPPDAARRVADLSDRLKAAAPAETPCTLVRGRTRHGHDLVTIANGYLRISVVPQVGGRIVELTDLIAGRNQIQEHYTATNRLPDLTGKRVYLDGFEDSIDRHDDAWRAPYDVRVASDTPAEVSIVARADVENPGEDGRKLRIERTMRLSRGSPVLAVSIRYTVLGGMQNVKMMPHPCPFVGEAPDSNDVFYVSSQGAVMRYPARDNGGDIYVPLDSNDHWAAICDRRDRQTLVNTFAGPVELLDIYMGKGAYTLEPYTPQIEGVAAGASVSMDLAYWFCYNLDAVNFANTALAGQLQLDRETVSGGENLHARVALVSATQAMPLRLAPRVLDAGGRVVKEFPAFTLASAMLVARPAAREFDVRDIPEGPYTLVVDVKDGDRTQGQMRAAFTRSASRGCLVDRFIPADRQAPARLAVLGRRMPLAPVVDTIERKDAAGATEVRLAGRFAAAGANTRCGRFQTAFAVTNGGSVIDVTHTFIPEGEPGDLIAEWACRLPLVLRGAPTQIRVTVGNDHKLPDVWRLDNTDEYYPSYLLSDLKRWPRWRLGGLLVDSPAHYAIWKSNRADTSPIVTYEGTRAPGWLDVSDADWGVTVVFGGDIMAQAPKGISFDAESGELRVSLHPSESAPLALMERAAPGVALARGRPATVHFSLEFHDGRHPTRMPLELTDAQYRRLLESVKTYWALGGAMAQAGLNTAGTPDEKVDRLLRADMPPSGILRAHVQLLAAAMKAVPGFAPGPDAEDNIRRLLGYYRTGELRPPPAGTATTPAVRTQPP